MPTYIATGRDLTLTLDGADISPQANSAELAFENTIETADTFTGKTKYVTGAEGNLTISAFQDLGAATSFVDALWDAADAGDPIPFVFTVDGVSFSGDVIPQFPTVGGSAAAALETSITLPISGSITKA
jgi:hypothetical protein